MNTFPKAFLLSGLILSCFFVACGSKENPSTPPPEDGTVLTASVVGSSSAPDVNSATIESVWSSAAALSVSVSPMGKNFTGSTSPFTVILKAIRTDQDVYFLAEYSDAAQDMLRQPLRFLGGNFFDEASWSFENEIYDDGFSLIFERDPGSSGAKTFTANGCAMLCHETTVGTRDPGMYPESAGRYDVWYWNAGKSNGSGVADDYMAIGSPNYELLKDDVNAEIYLFNVIAGSLGFTPYQIAAGNNAGLDKRFFIAEITSAFFDNTTAQNPSTNAPWTVGDLVPGYVLKELNGENGYYDVKARGYYVGGKWYVKFQRKLTTTDVDLDIKFISGNEYAFSFSVHNNNRPGNHYGVAEKKFTLKL